MSNIWRMRNRIAEMGCALLILLAFSPLCAKADPDDPDRTAFVATRYEVTIEPNFDARTIAGKETVRIRSQEEGLRAVTFSANALVIDTVTAGGRATSARKDEKQWTIDLPAPLARGGEAILQIDYHGAPTRGVTFDGMSVYTSYFACDWMFCNEDRPGEKAPISLTLVVPQGATTVGPGASRSIKRLSAGREAQTWRTEQPYSSYLYGFAAGAFRSAVEQHGRTEFDYFAADGASGDLKALFSATGAMFDFLQARAGVPFPWPRYAQVLIPGGDAQEAVRFAIVGVDEISPTLTDPTDDWVILHELAHQWWGNLITCKSWRELWLNEGVATYLVAAWKEYRWGRPAYDAEMEIARRRVDVAAKAGFDKPLAYAGKYPSLGIRRNIQYFKAELFLDALRSQLGDETFWQGFRVYTQKHAGGVVESRDFQQAMEEVSGRDLSQVFNKWVYDAGAH